MKSVPCCAPSTVCGCAPMPVTCTLKVGPSRRSARPWTRPALVPRYALGSHLPSLPLLPLPLPHLHQKPRLKICTLPTLPLLRPHLSSVPPLLPPLLLTLLNPARSVASSTLAHLTYPLPPRGKSHISLLLLGVTVLGLLLRHRTLWRTTSSHRSAAPSTSAVSRYASSPPRRVSHIRPWKEGCDRSHEGDL